MSQLLNDYVQKIKNAQVYQTSIKTPVHIAEKLSRKTGNTIYMKREDMQPVFSFKSRGACNKIFSLSDEELARGVVAVSAGNHAQGVALAAKNRGIPATIVMPKTTPNIKVESVRNFGADIVLHGDTYDDASVYANHLASEKHMPLIHPYDDELVIAGQGTVAMEICEQLGSDIDAVFVAVGGGGLLAGVAAYIKGLYPTIKVIGVEPENSNCLDAALKAGERVVLDRVGIFADGVAVKQIGEEPFRVLKDNVDEMILVSVDEICAGIKDIFEETRTIEEPAGALAIAGAKKYMKATGATGKTFVTINCGANMNFDRLRHVVERADIGEDKEGIFAIRLAENAGAFRKFCQDIGEQYSVSEFNYRYVSDEKAHIFLGLRFEKATEEKQAFIQKMQALGYEIFDLSDNEVAKLHLRYMVGGVPNSPIANERVYRFQFPERPGALLEFLTHFDSHWNVSMFHYRNHGAAYGRVLLGVQLSDADVPVFLERLSGYSYFDETENIAYEYFLKRS